MTGVIFLDGSADVFPWLRLLDRAGWGAIQITTDCRVVFGLYGTLPPGGQTAPQAEHYAVRAILAISIPPVLLIVDHNNILIGIANGRAWCEHPDRRHAAVWRDIWRLIDELGGIGPQGVRFGKCKAHVAERPDETERERFLRIGNRWADKVAKMGKALHSDDETYKASLVMLTELREELQVPSIIQFQWCDTTWKRSSNNVWSATSI